MILSTKDSFKYRIKNCFYKNSLKMLNTFSHKDIVATIINKKIHKSVSQNYLQVPRMKFKIDSFLNRQMEN